MLVAALKSHMNHFRIGFLQQPFCLLQPQILLLLPDGHAEIIPEQPAEVTFAASAVPGQVGQGRVAKPGFGYLENNLSESFRRQQHLGCRADLAGKFPGEDACKQLQQPTAEQQGAC